MNKEHWKKLQDFTDENKDMFIVMASPKEDAILITFGGLRAFVKFPGKDMSEGVVFNMLRKSKFGSTVDAFMTGVIDAIGISEKDKHSGEVLKVIGGAAKNIGEQRELLKDKINKKNVKTKN